MIWCNQHSFSFYAPIATYNDIIATQAIAGFRLFTLPEYYTQIFVIDVLLENDFGLQN